MQLHRPLHAAGYYLNPSIHYDQVSDRKKIDVQLEKFKQAKGLFGIEVAILVRNTKQPSNNFVFRFLFYIQIHLY